MESKISWFIFLTAFYIVIGFFMGMYANDAYDTVQSNEETLGVGGTIIKTISGIPVFMTLVFTLTTFAYIYIIATAFTFGGGG